MQTLIKLLVSFIISVTLAGCYSQSIARAQESPKLSNIDFATMSIGDVEVYNQGLHAREIDNIGGGIGSRKVIYRNHDELIEVVSSGSGEIHVITCINKFGDSEYVRIIKENTTIKDRKTLSAALKMISKYKFEQDSLAPPYQCGVIKLILDTSRRF